MSIDRGTFYQSRVPEVYGATITLEVVATIAVIARLVSRKLAVTKYWWDDLSIVLAWVLVSGICACVWFQYGRYGRHNVAYGGPVGPKETVIYLKSELAVQILYFFSATAIKTSLILLYWRIFKVIRWFQWLLAIAWIIVTLYFLVDLFVAIFECRPVAFYWDQSIKGGSCINQVQFYRWNGVANLLIDFMIWSLTLPVVWRLKLSTRQKLSLSMVFLLGIFACVASIVRVVAFNQVNPMDVTYTTAPAAIWTVIEQSMGIICACLPTTRPLFERLFPKARTTNSSGTDDTATRKPLENYPSRSSLRPLADTNMAGFERLDEEIALHPSSVYAHASRNPNDGLPVVTNGIMKHQTVEQHFDKRLQS